MIPHIDLSGRDWLFLAGIAVMVFVMSFLIADYERLRKQQNEDRAAMNAELAEVRGELALAKRSAQAMALRILQLSDDTGPIALDRPTPAQMAAPTRPDLTRQRPTPQPQQQPEPVHTGATAVGGRHRTPPKKKAS